MDDYQKISGVLSVGLEERRQVEEELHRLQHDAQQLRAARAAEEPLVHELENDAANLSAQIDALNKEQLNLTNSSHELKQMALQLGEILAQLKFELLSLKQENQRLRAQVVPDPEKAKRQLKDLGSALDTERGALEDQDRKLQELRTRVEALSMSFSLPFFEYGTNVEHFFSLCRQVAEGAGTHSEAARGHRGRARQV